MIVIFYINLGEKQLQGIGKFTGELTHDGGVEKILFSIGDLELDPSISNKVC